ncbi:DUF724 domain-containing protein, partial [Actinidia chinensis var. chinensis]
MRFKKGSKVEVLSKNEVPSGSWRCGEIIYGNGHYYTVRYETDHDAVDEAIVGRVSRKSIRPCPPLVSKNWVPGDVVEVFHNSAWKIATLSRILSRNYFLVRLLGSSHEFRISTFDLRVRQSWQDDKWFVIGKGASNCEDRKHSEWSTLKYSQKLSSQVNAKDTGMKFHVKDESPIVSSRSLKRGFPNYYSQADTLARTAQKFRVIEKECRRHRLLAANPSRLPEM